MMIYFVFLFTLISMSLTQAENSKTCSRDVCEIFNKLETDSNTRQEFETNSLKSGHKALRKVMEELDVLVQVEDDLPLQSYIIRYQNLLHNEIKEMKSEIELKLETFVIKIIQNITQRFSDADLSLSHKLDKLQLQISEEVNNQIVNMNKIISNSSKQTVDNVQVQMNKTPVEQIINAAAILKALEQSAAKNTKETFKPSNCLEIQDAGNRDSGVYTIYMSGQPIEAFCDMETNGGGWTVFLNRQNQSTQENFERNWKDYKEGFGNPPNENWLGNEALHLITNSTEYSVRVDAESDESPSRFWGEWSNFKVDSEDQKYRLTITGYDASSTMVDHLNYNNGQYFTTLDKDNDKRRGGHNCATIHSHAGGGGFWYNSCSYIFPTKTYGKKMFYPWQKLSSRKMILSKIQIKLRPKRN